MRDAGCARAGGWLRGAPETVSGRASPPGSVSAHEGERQVDPVVDRLGVEGDRRRKAVSGEHGPHGVGEEGVRSLEHLEATYVDGPVPVHLEPGDHATFTR